MYQKSSGLTKYIVLICDLLCIVASIFIADYFWHDIYKHISRGGASYLRLLVILVIVYFVQFLFTKGSSDFYVRGYVLEMWAIIKSNALLVVGVTLIMFFMKTSGAYSRMVLLIFSILNVIFMWLVRIILKRMLPFVYTKVITKRNAIIVGSTGFAEDIIKECGITKDYSINIIGTCLYDDCHKQDTLGIPVVSGIEELTDYCCAEAVDEVIIEINDSNRDQMIPIMDELSGAGILISYRAKLPKLKSTGCQAVRKAGDYVVATYATRSVSTGNLLVKRGFDIFAGLIGSIITLALCIVIAPAIKIESKGPVFFAQKRIGRNGRMFTIYKFRSMYADAEERKAELMEHNEMNGSMFKMADDPRITKVGRFLRKTSIDEFPQFFNVLSGDMSLVGTRPPTVDEFNDYNLDQKGRLSFRPGLTGLWQVSGRNDITDFEDIVALDKEYIKNWSPLYDLKIILRTIPVMLSGR